jgi:aminodeoxyfutalosine synthase
MTLSGLAERVARGDGLSDREIEAVLSAHDLVSIGMLGEEARRRRHGDRITFCRVFELDAAEESSAIPEAAGEVRIAGADSVAQACGIVRRVAACSAAPVSGFSLAALSAWATTEGRTVPDILGELRAAGLELIAEGDLDEALDARALREVSDAGLRIARVTVPVWPDDPADAAGLLRRVRELQAATGMIRALAPLPRRPDPSRPSTGYDDAKRVAVARLAVDNVETIQVDWAVYGPKLAQVALAFGADDLDRVPAADDRPELGPRRAPAEEARRNIRAAGLVPIERDGRFEVRA